jgi:putative transposase
MPARKKPVLPDDLVDQLMADRDPSTVLDKNGLLGELERAIAEGALKAEMDHHLVTEAADGGSNSRNGYGKKTVLTDTGKLGIPILLNLRAAGPALDFWSAADRQVPPSAARLR